MCLAIPAKVLSLEGGLAVVDVGGNKVEVNTMLASGLAIGDYVVVHAGYVLEKIEPRQAKETLKLLEEFYEGNS